MAIQILIADDHQMMINGLKLILAMRKDLVIVGTADNGLSVLDQIQSLKPDILLLDVNMPHMNGFQTLKKLKSKVSGIKVIVLSMWNDKNTVMGMLENGAHGYLPKNTDENTLFCAIDQVLKGNHYVSAELQDYLSEFKSSRGVRSLSRSLLSTREIEIVQLIIEGLTNAEIANKLFLSVRTVDTHRKNIFHKLQVNNTASLVKHAIENKIILELE